MHGPVLSERSRLLELLHQHGILYASPTQPVLSRDGTAAQWMLDSLCVSLSPEGIALAGRCLLALLERFEGRQIATYGVTAIPLLTACVLQSGGRYHGLVVRKERKAHGSRKLIEGRIDPGEPVVILDDSVSSGTTMTACCACLEEAGLRVEGGVCLVRFGWYGGFALMQERGYRMEAVYDIWDDFMATMEGEPDPVPNPTKVYPEPSWRADPAPEGLHPALLARTMIEAYLADGTLPRPPRTLDAAYDAAGGSWVSVRARGNVHLRHARDGFWHFPGEPLPPLGEDLARAALKTARALPAGEEGLRALADSGIAVTFFSRLEEASVGELDNDRYGIVVRSRERPARMGGALPRMPGIVGAWQQFQHARRTNAGLVSFEPYRLYRHGVVKAVEPGVVWQPTGVPRSDQPLWQEDPSVAGPIAGRARAAVLEALDMDSGASAPLPPEAPVADLDSVYVTVYQRGRLRGCMGAALRDLDAGLRRLAALAVADRRFAEHAAAETPEQVAVTVSLLYAPLELGVFSPSEVMARVRLGEQALMVHQGERVGLLLPFVPARDDLGPEAYALEVIDKAGITRAPYRWRRFECATWLADGHQPPRRLRGALPDDGPASPPAAALTATATAARGERLAALYSAYLVRHQRDDGRLYFRYRPHQDVLYEGGELPRIAHGGWVLRRAGAARDDAAARAAGEKLIGYLLPLLERDDDGHPWLVRGDEAATVSEVSFLLLALASAPRDEEQTALAGALAASLWSRIDDHGRIATHRGEQKVDDSFQDYFPGQALLALAAASGAELTAVDRGRLGRAFAVYRHRFRHRRRWGQVPWQMQAFAAWWRLLGDDAFARYVFEIADWLLGFQERRSGGFLNDHQADTPGYTTALYLEGLGAAGRLARAMDDRRRAARYADAFARGLAFLDRLTIQEPMAPLLPNPEWALGGVRCSLMRDEVRVDFVQHALSAVLELDPRQTDHHRS